MAKTSLSYRVKKDFYQQIIEQVQFRLGEEPKDILQYRKNYDQELRRRWVISNADVLIEKLQEAKLVLLADFHPLQQSQKSHLRLLKKMKFTKPVVLGVECLFREDQVKIDKFISGKLGEQEFLKSVQWKKKWGFPWEHYRPIFSWARENKVKVYGLNSSQFSSAHRKLSAQDLWISKRYTEMDKAHPDSQFILIYGDLHLAEENLPQALKKNSPSLKASGKLVKVFQNPEKIFFKLLKEEKENGVDVIQWSKSSFGLMNVPPWVKWQNYLLYLEKTYDSELDAEEYDNTDHVGQYLEILAQELSYKILISKLSVYTVQDQALLKSLEQDLSKKSLEVVKMMIEEERSFYLPQNEVAYLSRFSINHASALAMLYLQAQVSKLKTWQPSLPEDFRRLIWLETLSYFGSKIINSKRKTETLYDIKKMLSNKMVQDAEKESLRLALAQKMHELLLLTQRKSDHFNFTPKKKISYLKAAQSLGGVMGERLYSGYRLKAISLKNLKNLIEKDWTLESFDKTYYEIIEVIEALPQSFKSKTDLL